MGPYGLGFPHDDLPNNGWKLYVTSLVMIVTSGLFVLARVSTRVRLGQLGKDDIAIAISWVSTIPSADAKMEQQQHAEVFTSANGTRSRPSASAS